MCVCFCFNTTRCRQLISLWGIWSVNAHFNLWMHSIWSSTLTLYFRKHMECEVMEKRMCDVFHRFVGGWDSPTYFHWCFVSHL